MSCVVICRTFGTLPKIGYGVLDCAYYQRDGTGRTSYNINVDSHVIDIVSKSVLECYSAEELCFGTRSGHYSVLHPLTRHYMASRDGFESTSEEQMLIIQYTSSSADTV